VTRESLTDKLGKLEDTVRESVETASETVTHTVEEVKEAVASTVDGVKDAVSSTVDGVKGVVSSVSDSVSTMKESVTETFNIPHQVQNHPWEMVGAAVAVGFAGGFFLGGLTRQSNTAAAAPSAPPTPTPAPAASSWSSPSTAKANQPGLFDTLFSGLSAKAPGVVNQVFSGLEELAVGSLAGVARDLIRQSAPEQWKEGLSEIINDVAVQLTGKKIPESTSGSSSNQGHNGGSGHGREQAGTTEAGFSPIRPHNSRHTASA